jgi:RNA recognition motif-containing protein
MPDNNNSDGRRRRRRGRGRGPDSPSNNSGPQRQQNYKPTGFQKFLSVISFGLLGKPAAKPERPKSAPPVRFEGGDRPNRGERSERGDRGERRERDGNRPDRGERPAREPREARPAAPPAEVTSGRLYVGNLSYDASEGDLFELFNGVGKVQNAEVVVNNRTQRSKGFAFVTMAGIEEAKRAVAELNGKDFMGRALQISGAKPQPDRDSSTSGDEAPAAEEEQAAA